MINLLGLKSDIKYTFRSLAKSPGFVFISIFVLAGSLGLSAFTFTVGYTAFYKPIPLTNGESIYRLCAGSNAGHCVDFSAFDFDQIRNELTTLENIGIYRATTVFIEHESVTREVNAAFTEWNMFQLSESRAFLGRVLQEYDNEENAERVAVLGYDVWQSFFSSDPDIVGQAISVEGIPTTIVGVMTNGYRFPAISQIWLPISPQLLNPLQNEPDGVQAFARLKQSETIGAANGEIDNLIKRVRQLYPLEANSNYSERELLLVNSAGAARITTYPMYSVSGFQGAMITGALNLAAGLIFLLACINVGTLLLARTNERLKDISIRVALGASRHRLMFQAMGESIVITVIGAALAILLAGAGMELLNVFIASFMVGDVEFWFDFNLDESTVSAVAFFVIGTILITSGIPCWRIINGNFHTVMQDGTRGAVGLKSGRISRSLVMVSIVLVTVLLYVGTLFGSLALVLRNNLSEGGGENLIATNVTLNTDRYSANQRQQFFQSFQSRLLNDSDVSGVILVGTTDGFTIEPEGSGARSDIDYLSVGGDIVSGSLDIIGSRLQEGRHLGEMDSSSGIPTVTISRSLAQRLWPENSAIGQRLRIVEAGNGFSPWREVVGVLADDNLGSDQAIFMPEPDKIYLPFSQYDIETMSIIVKYLNNPDKVSSLMGETITQFNPELTVRIINMENDRNLVINAVDSGVNLVVGIGIFSFLMAVTGIFGLTKGSINLRTQEIGTRRALGARDRSITRDFLKIGSKQVLIGFVIAMVIAFPVTLGIFLVAGTTVLTTLLFSVLGVITALYVTVLVAIIHPIRKVLEMEPIDALRHV